MGQASAPETAELIVEFADVEGIVHLAPRFRGTLNAAKFDWESIPDLSEGQVSTRTPSRD